MIQINGKSYVSKVIFSVFQIHRPLQLCVCSQSTEPFDFTNTAHSCYDPHKFQWIRRVFAVSYEALYTTTDLKSILEIPSLPLMP